MQNNSNSYKIKQMSTSKKNNSIILKPDKLGAEIHCPNN